MFENCIVVFILLITIRNTTCHNNDRIIGGQQVNIDDYPYQLLLLLDESPICGASLVSASVALSAGHCIVGAGSYAVRAGSTQKDSGGQIVYVKEAILHPNYRHNSHDYDISILKLFQPFEFSKSIQPVKLPSKDDRLVSGTYGTVSGWGSVKQHGKMTEHLMAVQVPLQSSEACKITYGFRAITPRMMCAGYSEGGKDSCQGDSGGPLVVNKILYGIVSWGVSCAEPGLPGVYTNVAALRDYIQANAGV